MVMLCGDRHLENDAVAPAILGHVGDAVGDRFARAGDRRRGCAVEPDLAGIGGRDAEEDARQFGASRADQTGEADDFAGAHFERDSAARRSPRSRRSRSASTTSPGALSRRRIDRRDFAADHQRIICASSSSSTRFVPTLSPSRSTVTRSASAKISSSRCEM